MFVLNTQSHPQTANPRTIVTTHMAWDAFMLMLLLFAKCLSFKALSPLVAHEAFGHSR
jgi:hypothetical protein